MPLDRRICTCRGKPKLSKFSSVSQSGLAVEALWNDQNRQWRWRGCHSRLLPGSVAESAEKSERHDRSSLDLGLAG